MFLKNIYYVQLLEMLLKLREFTEQIQWYILFRDWVNGFQRQKRGKTC